MVTIRPVLTALALVCAGVAVSKLLGLRIVAFGSTIEWAAVAIAVAQVR